MAGEISDSVLAGIGVTTKIMMFPFSIILGFGSGFQPVAGFNWGARKYDRVLKSYRFSAWAAIVGSIFMSAVLIILVDPIIVAFAGDDPQMRQIGALSIVLQCLVLPIHGWVAVINMLCAGLGNAKGAFLLATARQGTCMLPVLFPLAYFFKEFGLASVQAIADVLTLALAIPIILSTIKKIKKAQAQTEALTTEV